MLSPFRSAGILVGATLAALPARLSAQQGANPVSQAVVLQSEGKREAARRTLSDYLANRPEDAGAWLELGRAYLTDARTWFLGGRKNAPNGILFLDFAATALDQAHRLGADSAALPRNLVEMERAAVVFGELGPTELAQLRPSPDLPALPEHVAELGRNLAAACPQHAVAIPGNDLEAVALWHVSFATRERGDLVVLRPDWYLNDGAYRRRMATALDIDRGEPLRKSLAQVAARRRICLTPFADASVLPRVAWEANGLARTNGGPLRAPQPLPLAALMRSLREPQPWAQETREVYAAAAAYDASLCPALGDVLGTSRPAACRR
ncbi:MAG: hypothetical protein NW201_07015 [Gemmatimonadales bacterium]|nr:hypothetical protein [Gemmatimonadales bacterium]